MHNCKGVRVNVRFEVCNSFGFLLTSFPAFPLDCSSYAGPFNVACLSLMFEELGCVTDGLQHPRNLKNVSQLQLGNLGYFLLYVALN